MTPAREAHAGLRCRRGIVHLRTPFPEAEVLVMKLGAAALLVALAAVGVAAVTDLVPAAEAPGIAVRAAGAIAILTALGAALSGLLARRGSPSDTRQQRVP